VVRRAHGTRGDDDGDGEGEGEAEAGMERGSTEGDVYGVATVETTRSVVVHHTSTTVVMTRHLVVEGQEEVFADGFTDVESQAGATQRDDGTGADGKRAWGTLAQRQQNCVHHMSWIHIVCRSSLCPLAHESASCVPRVSCASDGDDGPWSDGPSGYGLDALDQLSSRQPSTAYGDEEFAQGSPRQSPFEDEGCVSCVLWCPCCLVPVCLVGLRRVVCIGCERQP
jgi:hypothetical protein